MAEGPHLYRIGDYWYMMLAEGGTERGHCVTVARAPSPRGPFESCPWNPIFTHRSSSHPVQNVGHADLVETPTGDWAAVYLGVRPRGSTPGFHVLGRETFLSGVDWVDGWPVFDSGRFGIPVPDTGFDENFEEPQLDPRWVVPGGEPQRIVAIHPDGGLAFASFRQPSDFLCTRVRDFEWSAEAIVEAAGMIGLRLDDRHWCGVLVEDGTARALVQIGDVRQEVGSVAVPHSTRVRLRISSVPPRSQPIPFGYAGPDDLILSVELDGKDAEITRLDGRYFSTEVAAGFTGRMLALGCPSAAGRVVSVSYTPRSA